LAKATQRWNVLLAERFAAAGSSATASSSAGPTQRTLGRR
jgi:hypothetical protein